jgi:hypothetical protein
MKGNKSKSSTIKIDLFPIGVELINTKVGLFL